MFPRSMQVSVSEGRRPGDLLNGGPSRVPVSGLENWYVDQPGPVPKVGAPISALVGFLSSLRTKKKGPV